MNATKSEWNFKKHRVESEQRLLKLHLVQAEQGDSFILEFAKGTEKCCILIDGGPSDIFEIHLRTKLEAIRNEGGLLDLVVLSHVDGDHITGLLDLFAKVEEQRTNQTTETIAITKLWHNSFDKTIGSGNDIAARLANLIATAGILGPSMSLAGLASSGIEDGHKLRVLAKKLKIPINPESPDKPISVDNNPEVIELGELKIRIVGPTDSNLKKLEKKWTDWLDNNEALVAALDPNVTAMVDRSVPNLSSIMFIVEADAKKILFTGDARGDHLEDGLQQLNLLKQGENYHVDVLKVPHHGSDRNATRKFFKTVTADMYIISANNRDNNPDLATLIWIVEAAKEQNRKIEIIVTNETPSTIKIQEEYDPDTYGYTLRTMKKGEHFLSETISP
ncbi:MAG: ComEC/Rec2 family competence protein [Candidatus Thorarchaeota archaeon]